MLTHRLDPESGIIEIELNGPTEVESYRALVRELDEQIKAHGKINVLEIVRDLGWISPTVWWEDFGWSFRNLRHFSRVALVTDTHWIASVARATAVVLPYKLRVFPLAEVEAARKWLAE